MLLGRPGLARRLNWRNTCMRVLGENADDCVDVVGPERVLQAEGENGRSRRSAGEIQRA